MHASFLILAFMTAGAAWFGVLVGWLCNATPSIRETRSQNVVSALVAVVAIGTVVAQVMTPRPADLGFVALTGAIAQTPPRAAELASQATAILALGLASALVVANGVRSRTGLVVSVSLAMGILFSSFAGSAGGFVRGTIYLPVVLLGVSAASVDRTCMLKLIRGCTRLYVYGSLLAALVAPAWAFHGAPGGILLPGVPGRLFGVGIHPNYLGITAVVAVVVEVSRPRARFWQVHMLAAIAVLSLAGSRMAWSALGVAALVGALSVARRRSIGVAVCAALGLAAIAVYLGIAAHDGRALNLSNRTPIWHQTVSIWQRSPWFGVGPDLYRGVDFLPSSTTIVVDQAHNQVLQTLAESGVVGMALLLVAVAALVRAAVFDWRRGSAMAMAILGTFVALTFTESPLWVTGASHAMLVDVLVFLVVVQAPLAEKRAAMALSATEPFPKRRRLEQVAT